MYTKIESQFWTDEKFKPTTDEIKLCYLYLLSSKHKNLIGLYYLPLGYVCSDLGWTMEKTSGAIKTLIGMGRIIYDYDSCVILILNYFKHNRIQNMNQAKSGVDKLNELPENSCLIDFEIVVKKYYKPFMKPLLKRLQERLGKPVEEEIKEDVTGEGEITETVTPEKYFNEKINSAPNPRVYEEIKDYIDMGVEEKLIKKAIDLSIDKKKPNWNYINGILRNWVIAKIFTLSDFEKTQKKSTGPPGIEERKANIERIREKLKGDSENDGG